MARALRFLVGLATPPWLGTLYVLFLAHLAGERLRADKEVMGIDAGHVTDVIQRAFPDHVAAATRMVVLSSVVLGVGIGLVVAGVLALRRRARLGQVTWLGELAWTVALVPLVHGLAVWITSAARPAALAASLYDKGGLGRLAQVLAADVLGVAGTTAASGMILLALALGDPRRWPRRLGNLAHLARRRAGALALAALAWVVVAWPSAAPERRRPTGRPNVLVVAVDSLRRDRIDPRTAPALAAFAREAVTFDRAHVTIPRTFPSWVTALTGKDPHHHGIRSMFPSVARRERDFDALPGRLARAGYATFVASDYAGDIFPRVQLGFQKVLAPTFHFGEVVRQRVVEGQPALSPLFASPLGRRLIPQLRAVARLSDGAGVTRDALAAIDGSGARPFFGVVFYGGAHFPYAAPGPHHADFAEPGYRGRYRYEKQNRLGREAAPDQADERQVRALYDGAVRATDGDIAALLAGLDARGLREDTVVVVTADHGEGLFDDGRGHGHGDHLFGRHVLEVPFLVRAKGATPRHVPEITRDVDLVPSVLELVGEKAPEGLDGQSWAKALRGEALGEKLAFAETGLWFTEEIDGVPRDLRIPYPDVSRMLEVDRTRGDDVVLQERFFALTVLAKHRAVSSATHRLVFSPTRAGVRRLFFDLARDPDCKEDLHDPANPVEQALERELMRWTLEDRELFLAGAHFGHRGSTRDLRADARVRVEAGP